MDQLPKCVLKYLIKFCYESYHHLRVVNKFFATNTPLPRVRNGDWKIMRPTKMLTSTWKLPISVQEVNGIYDSPDELDLSHLINLRDLKIILLQSTKIIIPDCLQKLTMVSQDSYCDLSNTQMKYLEIQDNALLLTAPITLEELHVIELEENCKKFVNLKIIKTSTINCDLMRFTKLEEITLNLDKPYQFPDSIKKIYVKNFNTILEYGYLSKYEGKFICNYIY